MMAPTAIVRDDGALAVTGTGGSKRIRTAILQVLSNLIDFDMPLADAIDAPRLHVDEDHVNFEAGFSPAAAAAIAAELPRHTAWPDRNMFFGGAHTVMRDPDGALHGRGDPRRDGVCLSQ